MPRGKKTNKIESLMDFRSKLNTNSELSDKFREDVLRVTGLDVDDEGYVVDSEEDPFDPDYVCVRKRVLRVANRGILHEKDMIFDPYNNTIIMEELFKQYLQRFHPEVSSSQIYAYNPSDATKSDSYGYITILYNNGAKIITDMHHKDSTKYLDAFMKLEAMDKDMVRSTLKPYDDYESTQWKIDIEKLNSKKG